MSVLIILFLFINSYLAIDLCTYYAFDKYTNLINNYPENEKEFSIMSKIPLAIWYTDRDTSSLNNVKRSLANCGEKSTIVVIYGLPNKDCEAGFSSGGTVKSSQDYEIFITNLQEEVSNKPIIYILEPDALGLTVGNGCGVSNNYIENMKKAVSILSKNPNAVLYIEVSWWKLIYDDKQVEQIIELVKQFNNIKGIATNVSNYRKTEEMIKTCDKLIQMGYSCMIDTSRNFNGPSTDNQWCNLKTAGIGNPPMLNFQPGIDLIWIKPAVEIDGPCVGNINSFEEPQKKAGDVSIEYFNLLWKNGAINC